jgi:hypothetical protein
MEYTFNRLSKLAGILKEDAESDITDLIANVPDYTEFVNKLSDLSADPKVQNFIKSGKLDGSLSDDVVTSVKTFINVRELRPTQNEIDVNKSLKFPLTNPTCTRLYLKGGNITVKDPIVTLNGKYIIDGHHRWSQVYALNPDANIACFDLKIKIKPIDVLKIIQLGIAGEIGEVPTAEVQGQNLLKISNSALKAYVNRIISNECLDVCIKFADSINDNATASDIAEKLILPNVNEMRKTSKPISNAPDRNVMPQTDAAPEVLMKLAKGDINYNKPYPVAVQQENKKFLGKLHDTVLQESINTFSKIR